MSITKRLDKKDNFCFGSESGRFVYSENLFLEDARKHPLWIKSTVKKRLTVDITNNVEVK